MDNIVTEDTGAVSSTVSTCDTDFSHQNRIDDLDLAENPKAFIELNSKEINYFSKL